MSGNHAASMRYAVACVCVWLARLAAACTGACAGLVAHLKVLQEQRRLGAQVGVFVQAGEHSRLVDGGAQHTERWETSLELQAAVFIPPAHPNGGRHMCGTRAAVVS